MKTSILKSATPSVPAVEPSGRHHVQLQVVRLIAALVILLGATMLFGWLLDLDELKRLAPWFDPVKVNSAFAFLLLGLLLQLSASPRRVTLQEGAGGIQRWVLGLATGVFLIGLTTLMEYAFRADFGIDQLLAIDTTESGARYPGRMSLVSSITLIFFGSFFILRSLRLARVVREWFALGAFTCGYLALIGYIYGAESLYRVGATAMPAQSAVCVLLVASACLLLPPHYGFMRTVLSRGPGGLLVRRLLPVALFIAPAVDWIQARAAAEMGESSLALVGLANVCLLVVLVWATGKAVQLAQSQRLLAEENVKATEERLRLALNAAGGAAWDLDLVRNEAWWSAEMYTLWQVEPARKMGLENSIELIDPQDRERVTQAIKEAIDGHTLYHCDFRLRGDGSHERWMASRGRVLYDESGKAARLTGITIDITAQKATETSLRQTNEALSRSNVELQRFAHVAAHDLQTPLRSIGSFAELLKTQYESQLDKKGRDWLNRIQRSAVQLQALVRDLLVYSNIETQPAARVSMEEILDRALTLLDSEIQDSRCVITRVALPVVLGDSTQLVQLFSNLVENAIKYRSPRTPSVHISVERSDDAWLFSIRDNGIGFESRHSERIFELFERLHTTEEYPGTGIGLAICRRIVQRHGGNIWVESQPDVGSTFFFTIPIPTSAAQ